jgi:hypothetical protein
VASITRPILHHAKSLAPRLPGSRDAGQPIPAHGIPERPTSQLHALKAVKKRLRGPTEIPVRAMLLPLIRKPIQTW